MSILGNILWFIFGGFLSGISWCISGLIWCITIIGIPYGKQCFKILQLYHLHHLEKMLNMVEEYHQ